jgi:DNA polymerase V
VLDLCDLEESVATYTAKAAEKLRREQQFASGATIYFQMYPEYEGVKLPAGEMVVTVTFPEPTDDTGKMLNVIRPKLEGIYVPGRRYKKSGVIFFGLESGTTRQLDLFQEPKVSESSKLFRTVDALNAKFGKGTIFSLGEGIRKPWQMKRDLLTPSYTTSWDQLLKVK